MMPCFRILVLAAHLCLLPNPCCWPAKIAPRRLSAYRVASSDNTHSKRSHGPRLAAASRLLKNEPRDGVFRQLLDAELAIPADMALQTPKEPITLDSNILQ